MGDRELLREDAVEGSDALRAVDEGGVELPRHLQEGSLNDLEREGARGRLERPLTIDEGRAGEPGSCSARRTGSDRFWARERSGEGGPRARLELKGDLPLSRNSPVAVGRVVVVTAVVVVACTGRQLRVSCRSHSKQRRRGAVGMADHGAARHSPSSRENDAYILARRPASTQTRGRELHHQTCNVAPSGRSRTLFEPRGGRGVRLEEESVVLRRNNPADVVLSANCDFGRHLPRFAATHLICPRLMRMTLSLTRSVGADVVSVRFGSIRLCGGQTARSKPAGRRIPASKTELRVPTERSSPDVASRQSRLSEQFSPLERRGGARPSALDAQHLRRSLCRRTVHVRHPSRVAMVARHHLDKSACASPERASYAGVLTAMGNHLFSCAVVCGLSSSLPSHFAFASASLGGS